MDSLELHRRLPLNLLTRSKRPTCGAVRGDTRCGSQPAKLKHLWTFLAAVLVVAADVPSVSAQQVLPSIIDAPPAPVAPATIARDAQGRATIRAVRLQTPIKVDGRLDDEVYHTVPGAGGFMQ